MRLLTDKLPRRTFIDGIEYNINTDFRRIIEIQNILEEDEEEVDKMFQIMMMFYNEIPENIESATDYMIDFMCGMATNKKNKGVGGRSESTPTFSFAQDGEMIYSAFVAQYGVNLLDIEYMHWFEFRALFRGLDKDHLISEVMHCRTVDIDPKWTNEKKEYYSKMKKMHAIKAPKHVDERMEALEQALLTGIGVAEVLNGKG